MSKAQELSNEYANEGARAIAHVTHGHTRRKKTGEKDTPTYRSWCAMRTRCNSIGRDNSDRYKDRGVAYCDRWDSFENFLADMGIRPTGTTLDRWPNLSGNYEPGNCRWATPREQARNTRRNVLTLETATEVAALRLNGIPCKVIAEKFGISESLPKEIVKGRCWPDALAAARASNGGKA